MSITLTQVMYYKSFTIFNKKHIHKGDERKSELLRSYVIPLGFLEGFQGHIYWLRWHLEKPALVYHKIDQAQEDSCNPGRRELSNQTPMVILLGPRPNLTNHYPKIDWLLITHLFVRNSCKTTWEQALPAKHTPKTPTENYTEKYKTKKDVTCMT